jgi:hypothetical protein
VSDGSPTGPGLLPDGARLLHIGPHKTGTTSLQAALFASRAAMLEQGVRHLGRTRNPAAAVRAVTGQPAPTTPDRPPSMRYWKDLVGEFRRAREPRVVVSSEFFAWARPEVIERIADDLDGDRLHVVVTLRPLGRILPSQWQQNVQAGLVLSYDDWLAQVFGTKKVRARTAFWRLHRHDELIERWAAVLGRDRVTAIVVDERDHGMLLRTFESLLGLREGTIAADHDLSNRSMTVPEVEAVRAFNAATRQLGIPRAVHAKAMRFGAAIHMKQRIPDPTEARIETPQWALDRAREVDLEIMPAIEASGVRVIGDLSSLGVPLVSTGSLDPSAVTVPPRIAADMAVGILLASGLARAATARGSNEPAWIEPIEVARVSTWQLVGVLARRGRESAARPFRRLARRPAGEPGAE